MTLTYSIKFLDYWHLGSGLSAGAKLDSTVVKDCDGIPFVPAKTIKGLVREMALELQFDCDFIDRCFGTTSDKDDKCYIKKQKLTSARCYFANATLDETTHGEIVSNKLQDNLYDVIAFTKIGSENKFNESGKQIEKKGIAVDSQS